MIRSTESADRIREKEGAATRIPAPQPGQSPFDDPISADHSTSRFNVLLRKWFSW
jgi:hypothetical protein